MTCIQYIKGILQQCFLIPFAKDPQFPYRHTRNGDQEFLFWVSNFGADKLPILHTQQLFPILDALLPVLLITE